MSRRALVYLLLVVTTLPFALSLGVVGGHVYSADLMVEKTVSGTTWVGVYGKLENLSGKYSWTYFSGPFAEVPDLSPANDVHRVELNLLKSSIGYTDGESNWYVIMSPADDVNLYSLESTCDLNADSLVGGSFCSDCIPSRTYTREENIYINGSVLCVKYALLSTGNVTYLVEWNGKPVYVTPLRDFTLDGNTYNFLLLLSSDGGPFYLYLARKKPFCGDNVCDPGEQNCADCIDVSISVDPSSQEVNVGETATYTVTIENNGSSDLEVNLSLVKVAGGDDYAYTMPTSLTVSAGSSASFVLTLASDVGGAYSFRVKASVSGVDVYSDTFYFIVKTSQGESEETGAGGGGGGATAPPEENVEASPMEENRIVATPRGYYIPWLGCISYIHVYSPDSVTVSLDENKSVPVVVQNVGTCDENISFFVRGVDSNFYRLESNAFILEKGKTKSLLVTFIGYSPGTYQLELVAKGYYESKRKMTLVVKGEKKEKRGCRSRVLLLSPDVVEMVEGEEVNSVLEVKNEGTCIEDVSLRLTKRTANMELLVDSRNFKLPPGERLSYRPPKLAAGEYLLSALAGSLKKEVKIIVKPRSEVSNIVQEVIIQARFAILLLLLLVVLAAISYIRGRYLS